MFSIEFIEQKEACSQASSSFCTSALNCMTNLQRLRGGVPPEIVTGQPVLVLHYVSSEKEGTLAELGFRNSFKQVLSVIHTNPIINIDQPQLSYYYVG